MLLLLSFSAFTSISLHRLEWFQFCCQTDISDSNVNPGEKKRILALWIAFSIFLVCSSIFPQTNSAYRYRNIWYVIYTTRCIHVDECCENLSMFRLEESWNPISSRNSIRTLYIELVDEYISWLYACIKQIWNTFEENVYHLWKRARHYQSGDTSRVLLVIRIMLLQKFGCLKIWKVTTAQFLYNTALWEMRHLPLSPLRRPKRRWIFTFSVIAGVA